MLSSHPLGAGLSRRQFIDRLAAVGGVSLAMAGMDALGFGFASAQTAPPKLGAGKTAKVIVLGAGLAGLTTAYELSKAGYAVQVLEARDFAGGRCQTARKGFTHTDLTGAKQVCEFDEGLYLNHGPWRIPYHHGSVLHYTQALGVPLELMVNDNDAAYVYYKKGSGPLAGKRMRRGELTADVRGQAAELMAKVAGKGDLDAVLSAQDRALFVDYLVRDGSLSAKDLSYDGAHGRGYLVKPGAGVDPGPGQPAKPYALTDILASGAWKALSDAATYDHPKTMFQAVGGMDMIAKAFAREVGPMIRYSAVVEKIGQSPSGVTVAYRDATGAKAELSADYCVCTIPLSVLSGVDLDASAPFKAAMSACAYTPVNKIGLQMKRRFWEENHQIYGGHIHTDFSGVGNISLPSTGWQGRKGVVLGAYAFGGDAARVSALPPAERAALAVRAGQEIFPEYAENVENAFSFCWHLADFNLGGWGNWSPDARKEAYPVLCEPDGRLYLAGEHLSYLGGWQAGAIESAWQQIVKLHTRVQQA
jgi:monoamine oxidase